MLVKKIIGMILISISLVKILPAQDTIIPRNINLNLGLGYSYYLTSLEYKNLHRRPFVLTTRLMWQPEHLLRIGLESGYVPLYLIETKDAQSVFGETDVNISLDAVPILFIFSMAFHPKVEIFGGIGGFILISEMDSFDNKVSSTSWSNGSVLGSSLWAFEKGNWCVGVEVKTYYISKIDDWDLLLQLRLQYKLFSF